MSGVDPDRFGLGEVVDGCFTMFTPEPRFAHSAPGQADIGRPIGVHPDRPGSESAGKAVRTGDVLGPDTGGEAVRGVVGKADRLFLVREGDHSSYGAEDLLLRD